MKDNLFSQDIFKYFKDICDIPHGSGNMKLISDYCVRFAKDHGFKYIQDGNYNVIIYKNGTVGYENSETVILQAHLDMVCQKNTDYDYDFEKNGIDISYDDNFIFANNTTLGADNGIAVAMILSVLSSDKISHPPIEAVFTTDEEIGMIGASNLDLSLIKGKRLINLDAEEEEFVTVSCAGGADCKITLPVRYEKSDGTKVWFCVNNLKGGHSGIEIDKGRINANILMGKILDYLRNELSYDIIRVNGGTKDNAIPFCSDAEIVTANSKQFCDTLNNYLNQVKVEIMDSEENFTFEIKIENKSQYDVLDKISFDKTIDMLLSTPNGILHMNPVNKELVETSLNLGVLNTNEEFVTFSYALRSNSASSLDALMDKMTVFGNDYGCNVSLSGKYLPWEYNPDSKLCSIYVNEYFNVFKKSVKPVAIHAGLECAVFASSIKNLDCIAIGPDIFGAHTVEERVSISSVMRVYEVLSSMLEKLI